MSKKAVFANYFNFNGGLQTDMSPLNIEPSEAVDIENVVLENDGSVRRAKGMDVLSSTPATFSKSEYSPMEVFYWETYNMKGKFRKYVAVITIDKLTLYDPYVDALNSSPVKELDFGLPWNLGTISIEEKRNLSDNFSFAVDGSRIIIAHGLGYPFYIYLDSGDNLQMGELPIFIRNSIFDNADTIYRTWKSLVDQNTDDPTNSNNWEEIKHDPNAELWDSNHTYSPASTNSIYDGYQKDAIVRTSTKITADNEKNYYYTDLKLKEFEDGRYPEAVCVSGGRLFVGGSLDNESTVYFSQVLEGSTEIKEDILEKYKDYNYGNVSPNIVDYTKFFTENPPWSLTDPSVVADDGGYVKISGAERIFALTSYKSSVLIFARNGVWRIYGRDGVFSAADYGVEKLTDAGLVSKKAITTMENYIVYASDNGIYTLFPEKVSGELTAFSLTENKIDTLYNSIPVGNKELTRLNYDRDNKRIYFLYNSTLDRTLEHNTFARYGDVLIYNTKTKAWYKKTLAKEETVRYRPSNIFFMPSQSVDNVNTVVTNSNETVVTNSDATVLADFGAKTKSVYRAFIVLDKGNTEYTFGYFESNYLYDFYSLGEAERENYVSYLVTSHQLYEDIARMKQLPYMHVLFKRTETGVATPLGIDSIPSDAVLRMSLGFTGTAYIATDVFGEDYIKNAQYGKKRYIYPKKRNKFDMYKDFLLYTQRLLGRGKALQFHISNRRDERAFECNSDGINTSPLEDTTNWTEILFDNSLAEWNPTTTYNTGNRVKVEIEYDFNLIGWACDLIAKEKSSGV